MKISFNPAHPTDTEVDDFLRDLAEAAKEKESAIRVRLQPQLYHPKVGGKGTGSYRSWRLLTWTLAMDDLDELTAFRGSLTHFISFLERYGPVATEKWFEDTLNVMAVAGDEEED